MPVTPNTIYTAAYNAIANTAAALNLAVRAEFVSRGDEMTPDRFILYRLQSEEGVHAADNAQPIIKYTIEFTTALPDTEENRAAIYRTHWTVRSALYGAGFIPQSDYDLGIDRELGVVYVSKTYFYYMEASSIQ